MLDDQTIKNYESKYLEGGLDRLLTFDYKGRVTKLTTEQEKELKAHVGKMYYNDSKLLIEYVKEKYGVIFSESGIVNLLHRLGFVYKLTKVIPAKPDPDRQLKHLRKYEKLKALKHDDSVIMFMDGVHPEFNSKPTYCWIEKGKEKEVRANTGRKRINLNGAVNINNLDLIIREDCSVNVYSTVELFKQIEAFYPLAPAIYIVADNAGYYRSKMVKEYLKNSRIRIVFIPPYSPNLNLIERLWKFYRKNILYDCCCKTFDEFRKTTMIFFTNIKDYSDKLTSLLTENFQIIGKSCT